MGFSLRINGEVVAHDANNDGILEEDEIAQQWDGTQDIVENTEMKDALEELNKDDIDPRTGKSAIDMRSRLHIIEEAAIIGLDSLAEYHYLPLKSKSISEKKKRLAVSRNGEGRKEIVGVTTGGNMEANKQQGAVKGFFNRLFGGGQKEEAE